MSIYLPDAFRVTDEAVLRAFIQAHSFGQLITARNDIPEISLLPFVFMEGVLQGHLALANPQTAHLEDGAPALAQFNGPHAFVSSTCYAPPSGIATWNYMTVQVEGRLRRIEDEETLWRQLDTLTQTHEAGEIVAELQTAARSRGALLRQITGFELTIDRMEGKFKLSQNRSAADRERIIHALTERGDENARLIAAAMRNLH